LTALKKVFGHARTNTGL